MSEELKSATEKYRIRAAKLKYGLNDQVRPHRSIMKLKLPPAAVVAEVETG